MMMMMKPTMKIDLKCGMALIIAISCILLIGNVDGAPYQELEPRKGYIPVYIRYGDTPLSQIHPALAFAFNEAQNGHIGGIEESASLIDEESESTDENKPKNVVKEAASEAKADEAVSPPVSSLKTEEKASDIASFDVIKGKDNSGDAKE